MKKKKLSQVLLLVWVLSRAPDWWMFTCVPEGKQNLETRQDLEAGGGKSDALASSIGGQLRCFSCENNSIQQVGAQ